VKILRMWSGLDMGGFDGSESRDGSTGHSVNQLRQAGGVGTVEGGAPRFGIVETNPEGNTFFNTVLPIMDTYG